MVTRMEKPIKKIKPGRCVICKLLFFGYGNNPAPVKKKGRCCNACDFTVVIPTRIKIAMNYRGLRNP